MNEHLNSADRVATLRKQVDRVRDELASERRRMARATVFTVIVALLALCAAGAYFSYGYKLFVEVTEPEKVVDVAEGLIDEKLPEARNTLEEQIIKSAPQWAEGLSKQAQDGLPEMRAKLSDRFIQEAEKATREAEILSEEHFRKYLRDNKPRLEQVLKDLANNPDLAEDSLLQIEVPLEKELGAQMNLDAREVCKDVASVRKNLERLTNEKGLSAEQRVERRVWMLARRLQLEGMGESSTRSSAPVTRPAESKPKGTTEGPAKATPTKGTSGDKGKEPSK